MVDARRRSLGAVAVLAFFGILTLAHGATALPFFEIITFAALGVVSMDDPWGWPRAMQVRATTVERSLRRAIPLLIGGAAAAAGAAMSIRRRLAGFRSRRLKYFEKIQKIIDLRVILTQKFLLTPALRGAGAPALA